MFVSAYAAVKGYLPNTPSKAAVAAVGAFLVKSYFQSSWPVTLLSGLAFSAIARIADRCLAGAPKLVDNCDSDDEWDFKKAKHSAPPSGPNSAHHSPAAPAAEPPLTPPPPLALDSASNDDPARAAAVVSPTDSESGSDYDGPTSLVMGGRVLVRDGEPVPQPAFRDFGELPEAALNPKHSFERGSIKGLSRHNFSSSGVFRPFSLRPGSPYKTVGEHGY
jgi:hypothetical protein